MNRQGVRAFFDQLAEQRDLGAAGVGFRSESAWRAIQRALVALTDDLPPVALVDLGCGHGQMSKPLARRHQLVGVDHAEKMCALAASEGLPTVAGDASALPFADGAFGGAIAIEVIQLIESAPALLREMARVVIRGGAVIVGTPNRRSVVRRVSHLAIEAGVLGRGSPAEVPLPILRTAGELVADAAEVGLRLDRAATTYFPSALVLTHGSAAGAEGLLASNILLRFTRA